MSPTDLILRLTDGLPITAGSFIVTVYGDVVVPRGEVLWIGSLIEICSRIGISENLVRTAVSRLVSADRLQGTRVGRRSFYRLAPAARAEFAQAARMLYARPQPSGDWLVMLHPDMPEKVARSHRMARIGATCGSARRAATCPKPEALSCARRPSPVGTSFRGWRPSGISKRLRTAIALSLIASARWRRALPCRPRMR
ncbi:hypothetical protein ACFSYD_21480 [Paracoccus aerius]